MFRKSSIWFVVLISVVTIAFIATGCAKKQIVKEEAAAKPMIETKKEAAVPAAKPASIDLAAMRIWFAFDDYNLSNHSKENLEKIANWMSKTAAAKVQIKLSSFNPISF